MVFFVTYLLLGSAIIIYISAHHAHERCLARSLARYLIAFSHYPTAAVARGDPPISVVVYEPDRSTITAPNERVDGADTIMWLS